MQCFIYRLVVAFPPVKCFHFWWLVVKNSNAVITGKGFLVSLPSCSNFCCSSRQAWLQREVLHQLGWCPGLRMAQTRGSVGHKDSRQVPAKGLVTGFMPGSAAAAPEAQCSQDCHGQDMVDGEDGVSLVRCHHRHQLCQITQCLSLGEKDVLIYPPYALAAKEEALSVSRGAPPQLSNSGARACPGWQRKGKLDAQACTDGDTLQTWGDN